MQFCMDRLLGGIRVLSNRGATFYPSTILELCLGSSSFPNMGGGCLARAWEPNKTLNGMPWQCHGSGSITVITVGEYGMVRI